MLFRSYIGGDLSDKWWFIMRHRVAKVLSVAVILDGANMRSIMGADVNNLETMHPSFIHATLTLKTMSEVGGAFSRHTQRVKENIQYVGHDFVSMYCKEYEPLDRAAATTPVSGSGSGSVDGSARDTIITAPPHAHAGAAPAPERRPPEPGPTDIAPPLTAGLVPARACAPLQVAEVASVFSRRIDKVLKSHDL